MKNEISGFSVIELVIALAVGAIVVTMAAPSMTGLVKGSRITATTNEMSTALNYARTESIRRQMNVSVVSVNGAGNWSGGWRVSTPNATLRTFPAPPATVSVSTSATTGSFVFVPLGFLVTPAGGDAITICDDRTGEIGRSISVTGAGSVSLNANFQCP